MKGLVPAFLCATTLNSSSAESGGNVIDLQAVCCHDQDFVLGSTGNFLKTGSGTVFFFAPSSREMFRQILAEEIAGGTKKFLRYFDGRQTTETLEIVKTKDGLLQIGNEVVEKKELNRIRVMPEWRIVDDFLKTAYQGASNSRQTLQLCSILRLDNGLFLISGGFIMTLTKT